MNKIYADAEEKWVKSVLVYADADDGNLYYDPQEDRGHRQGHGQEPVREGSHDHRPFRRTVPPGGVQGQHDLHHCYGCTGQRFCGHHAQLQFH